jgi:hypothetical protein
MKKIAAIVVLIISLQVNAQKSFEKNANVVAFGLDLGYYNYTSKIATSPTSESNPALNKMLSLHYERGVLNWLGIGAKVQLCDYFTQTDTVQILNLLLKRWMQLYWLMPTLLDQSV